MRKSGACLSILIFLSSICFSTASRAEGFLEMLFGGGHRIESQQSFIQVTLPRKQRSAHSRHFVSHHRRWSHVAHRAHGKKSIVVQASVKGEIASSLALTSKLNYAATPSAPVDAQAAIATILRDDPTLRPGDAYMTNDGLRVFVGEGQSDLQFVPVNQARQINKKLKARLAEVERTPFARNVRVAALKNGDAVGAYRKNAESKPAKWDKERLIRASNGKTIRLVGGYAS